MSNSDEIDYGPLTGLIGRWSGDRGMDISPEPDDTEENPYYETLQFEAAGDVDNAETQEIAIVWYRQLVRRKSNDKVFHDQTGYWMWDAKNHTVMHGFSIPRGVVVLAGGRYEGETDEAGRILLSVKAGIGNPDWSITQSPFMRDNAKTLSFKQSLAVGKGQLNYQQSSMLDIYGRRFDHRDSNELSRQN